MLSLVLPPTNCRDYCGRISCSHHRILILMIFIVTINGKTHISFRFPVSCYCRHLQIMKKTSLQYNYNIESIAITYYTLPIHLTPPRSSYLGGSHSHPSLPLPLSLSLSLSLNFLKPFSPKSWDNSPQSYILFFLCTFMWFRCDCVDSLMLSGILCCLL